MTVLVTGGSGLVGSHVIEALCARRVPVRALARPAATAAIAALGAEPVTGDVTDPAAWQRACAGGVSGIVHAAAIVQRPVPWSTYEAVNVGGTRLAVAASRAAGARLVHVSSVAVYGGSADYRPNRERRTEDAPFRPIPEHDGYGRSKREAEALVRAFAEADGCTGIAIRPNVIYGERDRLFTPRVMRGMRVPIFPQIGPGTNLLSCVYAGNVATAIVAALEAPVSGFRAYNITCDAPPPLTAREFLEAFAAACGVRPRFFRLPASVARVAMSLWTGPALARAALSFITGENPYVADRARAELNWTPPLATRVAIARTVVRWEHANEKPG
ncbi:MAG: NAD-dependent epimerase/dehydratase family protein [Gemmatimonadales bacterium]